jgi:hypothetical protein
VIWTYLGPRTQPPPFPELEWAQLPDEHSAYAKTLRECNWLQALEGDIDNAHVPFLHSRFTLEADATLASRIMYAGKSPHLEVVDTPYGAMYGSRREADEHHYNWRIIQFLFPCFTMITTGSPQDRGTVPGHVWVPIDDANTMMWGVRWNPTERLGPQRPPASNAGDYLPNTGDWLGRWRPIANSTNDYLIDREAQRTVCFSGLQNIPLEDKMVTESMGSITDRTQEHLGSTDAMVIKVRSKLLAAVNALRDHGTTPPCVDQPALYGVRSAIVNLPREANWVEATEETLKAFTGRPAAALV